MIVKNHIIVIRGSIISIPLLIIIIRELLISYDIFAKKNNIEEANPCATISIIAALIPHKELDKIPTKLNPICATEE
jgi:hypothetical protein